MKIIYIHQYFNTPKTSGSTRSYEFSKRLVQEGHKVIMITSYRYKTNNKSWFYQNVDGIDVYYLPNSYDNKFNFFKRVKSFLRFSILSIFKVLKFDFDIIIATSTPLTIGVPALICSTLKRKNFIFEVRDLWPELPIAIGTIKNKLFIWFLECFEKMIYTRSSKIIALSPGMKKGIIKSGISPLKIDTIPNSCDFELFKTFNSSGKSFEKYEELLKNCKSILYAGTFGAINDVKYLIDIAYYLQNEKIKIIIVGDGIKKSEIITYAKKLDLLNKNVFIFDELKKIDVVYFYKKCTISTSLFIDIKEMWANSANKYFDTMAAKKPIIINYNGWQSNLIKRYKTGLVIPPNLPKVAAKMILKIIYNQEILNNMAHNNFALGQKYFDRDKLYKKFKKSLIDNV